MELILLQYGYFLYTLAVLHAVFSLASDAGTGFAGADREAFASQFAADRSVSSRSKSNTVSSLALFRLVGKQ
ncbi:hypothetical protein BG74_07680 [Sodalis-like endosymbiont of Proechinophthirus fluctus]|nr:hypothetical protein BG74_07680 [Sodalis-like endosymbiont of Proechinophthirus fluctus]